MRTFGKRWTLVAVLTGVLVVALLILRGSPRATASAVAITFVAYTNPPGNHLRFALFSVSNQAPYAVRWRGSWVEVEGEPYHRAEIINPRLPGFPMKPALKAGGSLTMAIGAINCRVVYDLSCPSMLSASLTQATTSMSLPHGSRNESTV